MLKKKEGKGGIKGVEGGREENREGKGGERTGILSFFCE